jgi:uncharacterized protein YdbL (DUF1318 family)
MAALLAGCQSTQVVTAASGTKLQARDVVRLVYTQAGEPGSATLTYFAGDITLAVRRMAARFPQVRKALEEGRIGLTADAYLALHEPGTAQDKSIVEMENLDRVILYAASAMEVGHGINDLYGDWMPYERHTFASEWLGQAPAGWWHRDERGNWQRKMESPPATEKTPK